MHRFLLQQGEPPRLGTLRIEGDEARHAVRVKRLRVGEEVEVLDGLGLVAPGCVTETDQKGRWIDIEVAEPSRVEPVEPQIEVCCPPPKGDRLAQLIDTLSQVGAAAWRPLRCERAGEDPPSARIDRLERIAGEAAKQCGRAWVLRLEPPISFEHALKPAEGVGVIVADASGKSGLAAPAGGARLLVGPEGGWTPDELVRARDGGATVASFGAHVMRIETAGACGASILLREATAPGPTRNKNPEATP